MPIRTHIQRLLALTVTLLISLPLAAQDDEPLHPEDAYRYAASDTGSAIEVDWAIEDGYYLYRQKLSFQSDTAAVKFGEYELPDGLHHEDEFFGVQAIR